MCREFSRQRHLFRPQIITELRHELSVTLPTLHQNVLEASFSAQIRATNCDRGVLNWSTVAAPNCVWDNQRKATCISCGRRIVLKAETTLSSKGVINSGKILRLIRLIAGGLGIVSGVLAIVGWACNYERLTDWSGDGIAMFPNTSLCAILVGVALLSASRTRTTVGWISRCSAAVAIAIAGLTLCEHIFGWNLGIDTWIFNRDWGQRAAAAPCAWVCPPPYRSRFWVFLWYWPRLGQASVDW